MSPSLSRQVLIPERARVIKGYIKKGLDVYAYFNNDACAYAVVNAREFREMVEGDGRLEKKGVY